MDDSATAAVDARHPELKNPVGEGDEGCGRGPGVPAALTEDGRRKLSTQNSDFMDAVVTASRNEAGDFEEEEDRPRFCSLDPPSDVYRKSPSRNGHGSSHEEPCGSAKCGQVTEDHGTVSSGPIDDTRNAEAGDVEDEEDRPRSFSLDPPSDVGRKPSNENGSAPTHVELHNAIKRGQLEKVRTLVERDGVDLDQADEDGVTALHVAAGHRHCHEILRYLLESGASVGARDKSRATPLHAAASSRNAPGVRGLLMLGADVDARDNKNHRPLFVACQARAHKVIVELLEGGADPNLLGGKEMQTPLHAFFYSTTPGSSRASLAKSKAEPPSSTLAAWPGQLTETVDKMLKAGAPMTATDKSGLTVLDAAAAADFELMQRMLLEYDLNPTVALAHATRLGATLALNELLANDDVEPCSILNDDGSSLLHLAAARGSLECVKSLLTGPWLQRKQAIPFIIDARDAIGRTALFRATFSAFIDVAEFLLKLGASPAIQDMRGDGVGYVFADTVTSEQKLAVYELLQRWNDRSEEDVERAQRCSSLKAPGGDVIFFSGVVPFVHSSRTSHLCVSSNVPPAQDRLTPGEGDRTAARRAGKQRLKRGQQHPSDSLDAMANERHPQVPPELPARDISDGRGNPWRRRQRTTDISESRTLGGSFSDEISLKAKGADQEVDHGEAEQTCQYLSPKHTVDNIAVLGERAKSAGTRGSGLFQRDVRTNSAATEQSKQTSTSDQSAEAGDGRKKCPGELGRKGKTKTRTRGYRGRRQRSCSDAHEEVEESMGRYRIPSEATECTGEGSDAGEMSATAMVGAAASLISSPGTRHRKLIPHTMGKGNFPSAMLEQQKLTDSDVEMAVPLHDGIPVAVKLTPVAPDLKPSRVLRKFW